MSQYAPHNPRIRRGAATVELCLTAPFLLFMLAVTADFARVYYHAQVLSNCAWNGALYAADQDLADLHPAASAEEAALWDVSGLEPPPRVTVQYGTDRYQQPYVDVRVAWTFRPLLPFPGTMKDIELERKARVRLRPQGEED